MKTCSTCHSFYCSTSPIARPFSSYSGVKMPFCRAMKVGFMMKNIREMFDILKLLGSSVRKINALTYVWIILWKIFFQSFRKNVDSHDLKMNCSKSIGLTIPKFQQYREKCLINFYQLKEKGKTLLIRNNTEKNGYSTI